jgi:hypothetical protein
MQAVEQFHRNLSRMSGVKVSMSGTTEMRGGFESLRPEEFLSAPLRGPSESQLEQLKHKLLRPVMATIRDTRLARELSRAANEAAALAWTTICPILVLPELLDEKIQGVMEKRRKQQTLLRQ